MKKFILTFALLIGVTSFYNNTASIQAQTINISVNIGRQPAWGPVGYESASYYYMPEINCYYDVNLGMFYYVDRGYWVSARYLPYAYRSYDLYRLYKVVLDVRNPWRYNHIHYKDYGRYRGYKHHQVVIRDSRDHRYYNSRKNNVRWYSSDRYSVNRHDNRYSYNRNDNNKKFDNNRNNNKRYENNKPSNNYKKQDKQSSRPSYQGQDNSRSNNNGRYSNDNNKARPSYDGRQKDNKKENRSTVTNRSNDRNNNRQSVQRSSERNSRNSSSSRKAEYKMVSNERAVRNR